VTYAIDKKTMLFVDIGDALAREMREWCRQVVFVGKAPWPDPPWVTVWLKAFGFDERQRLLVLSSVLVTRVLWSLLEREGAQAALAKANLRRRVKTATTKERRPLNPDYVADILKDEE
jgi:hypothetical protein